ncbi:MAG TPA: DUF3500 domain-containing protein [Vicinamibacterales bacterium]|nr:DUF3500 domain-containing protein [Vicinamibacterales bacterium]
MMTPRLAAILAAACALLLPTPQRPPQALEPFKGITTDGTVAPGLFSIRATGVSTEPVKAAAERFLAALTADQRAKTTFAADDDEWRRWNNVHRAAREGVSFREMSEAQREAAYALMRASFSARGLQQSRDVMRLNGHLANLVNNQEEYGEFLYWITVMGTPSANEPWGWQLDGHHLAINYFVLGDQVVMTPAFVGSEPTVAEDGSYKGAAVLQEEQSLGEAFMAALDEAQRAAAVVSASKTGNNAQTQAYRDNVTLPYQGLRANALTASQKSQLLSLIGLYVGNMRDGHAKVKMSEVSAHIGDTYFSWTGGTGADAVFYYRIHSPVILIEFDHQSPVALAGRGGPPTRRHVHSVVRTPNGNDYGKDLLRQHYERHKHDQAHGHVHLPR